MKTSDTGFEGSLFPSLNRRQVLLGMGAATLGLAREGSLAGSLQAAAPSSGAWKVRYSLNTSTIREQKLSLVDEIRLVAKLGYQGIEPWMGEFRSHQESGGSLADLRKLANDLGVEFINAIGFARWIVDDPAERAKGLEEAKRDMDILAQVGCRRIAAPPSGATNPPSLDLMAAAERYAALLELGDSMGVIPQLEVWGFSHNLKRLSQTMTVALESGHPKARILPDVYHLHKGGTDFNSLALLSGNAIDVFHLNDYPADPPRETINDSHRVFPGLGVAPWKLILSTLRRNGFEGYFSLELFNRDYWKRDAVEVAQEGLERMKGLQCLANEESVPA